MGGCDSLPKKRGRRDGTKGWEVRIESERESTVLIRSFSHYDRGCSPSQQRKRKGAGAIEPLNAEEEDGGRPTVIDISRTTQALFLHRPTP